MNVFTLITVSLCALFVICREVSAEPKPNRGNYGVGSRYGGSFGSGNGGSFGSGFGRGNGGGYNSRGYDPRGGYRGGYNSGIGFRDRYNSGRRYSGSRSYSGYGGSSNYRRPISYGHGFGSSKAGGYGGDKW